MKVLSVIVLVIVLMASSCTKSEEKSTQAPKDYALMLTNISYVAPLIIHTVQSQGYVLERLRTSKDSLNSCASYLYVAGDTVAIENGNVVMEVLFSQCVDFDGAHKNGSLMINISNYFDVDSATCSVKLTDFSINNNIFTGTLDFKRKGSNEFEISTNDLKIFVGTKEISYKGTWLCEMGTGGSVNYLYDNLLEIEEVGLLNDRFGSLSKTIGTGLVRSISCNWIDSGISELEDQDGESQILDFGNGACDNLGVITSGKDDVSFAIGQ